MKNRENFIYLDDDFRFVQKIAQRESGITIPDSKKNLVFSRVSRRLRALGYQSFSEYLNFVNTHNGEKELDALICSLTTNVTHFFRENSHFEHFRNHVLPDLSRRVRIGDRARIWSSACSTGEELWSAAMVLMEAIPEARRLDVQLLGTDISQNVIDIARKGIYPEHELSAIPNKYRNLFMDSGPLDTALFKDDIRKIVTFNKMNLIKTWPFKGSFDVIFCRNVVIYFNDDTKNDLWRRLSERLVSGGYLYVGHSERVDNPELLSLEPIAATIYRKR